MKFKTLAIVIPALMSAGLFADHVKIACVGDSITYGDGVENREANNYPQQLQNMLGEKFEVRNFGVCGAALAKTSAGPYWEQPAYKQSLEFQPDVAIIKLGTNDSNPRINWDKCEPVFERDLNALIDTYEALESKPAIFLCLPVKCFGAINADEDALEKIRKMIADTAAKRKLPLIDLYTPLEDRRELFPDNLHPNAAGAKIIAETVFNFLKKDPAFKAKAKKQ